MVNLAMAVAVPLYIWPTINAWQPLYNTISASPNTTFNIIINPNSGPSNGASEPEIVSAVTTLRSYTNVQLFGYVHIEYGKRAAKTVHQDISTYSTWKKTSKSDIHLDGIFVDEAPYETKYLPYMKDLQTYIHKTMPKSHQEVWTNPGIPIDAKFYEYADYVNAYENSYADWSSGGGNKKIPECLRQKSTVMIHDFPVNANAKLNSDVKNIVAAGYNGTFITTSSGYEEFSASWSQYVKDVANLTRTTKVKTLPACKK
ncbi:hypothetical protein E4T48_07042 [Aureobasidium sp. EXF-10727]|nr:hypothetical protein E4T48_07042 [Aureobasidium sp. EXF-10727]